MADKMEPMTPDDIGNLYRHAMELADTGDIEHALALEIVAAEE